ncbi:uncharacterized protein LOC124267735 [Haliotis rubra]|uniref:uncharacterized protein LOC124267735 n=1 Tax=Haliotis rubra TaxID=36100 RepID=UPI001EE59FC7|nr:uncharacterized protein LOC124267735 [Haliotis rubra]
MGQTGRIKETFALLDSGSDVTLIQSSLADELCLKGKKQTLDMTTLSGNSKHSSQKVHLQIKGVAPEFKTVQVKGSWTYNGAFKCKSQHVDPKWKHLAHLNLPDVGSSQIQLLIGLDTPQAHLQEDAISGDSRQPYAVMTPFGWSLIGTSTHDDRSHTTQAHVNFIISQDQSLQDQIEHFWKTESFGTKHNLKEAISVVDRKAKTILDETTTLVDGHYQIDMLWKSNNTQLPNNYPYTRKRNNLLMKKLDRSNQFEEMYSKTLNQYIDKGYVTKVTDSVSSDYENNPRTWYIPHHGVQNPNKPGKVHVVFDAADSYKGTSLNDNLMCGPDLVNSLFGILQRFRLYGIVIAADMEAMYHQVPEHDSHSLQFLWKVNRCEPGPPDIYKMGVHIFGATDSTACANYAVKRTALDNADQFSPVVIHTVLHHFYVNELLKSVKLPSPATELSRDMTTLMEKGGFHLHKWISNSSEV